MSAAICFPDGLSIAHSINIHFVDLRPPDLPKVLVRHAEAVMGLQIGEIGSSAPATPFRRFMTRKHQAGEVQAVTSRQILVALVLYSGFTKA